MKNTDTDELCPAILRILIFLPPALSSITLIFKAVLYCNCTDAHFYKTLIMRSLFNGRFLKYECETSNFEKYSEKGRRPASAVGLYENFLKNSNFLKIFLLQYKLHSFSHYVGVFKNRNERSILECVRNLHQKSISGDTSCVQLSNVSTF